MKDLRNLTTRNLEAEEHMAILQACAILEKAFKRRVHSCMINPDKGNPDDVWGIAFAFDMYYMGDRKP